MTGRWFLAAAAFAVLAGCSKFAPSPVQTAEASTALKRVATVRAERKDLTRGVEVLAEFRPYQEVDVHAKVAGYLQRINVDVGDRVQAGQVLGVLEVPEFDQEMAHASAVEKRSELDVARAESEIQRSQAMFDLRKLSYSRILAASKARPNLIAQQEIDTALARSREAEANLATAKAALASMQQQVIVSAATSERMRTMMSYLRITSPFSGVVTRRYADPGAMIQAGTASQTQAMPIVRISQIDRLRLTMPIPESIVATVRLGSPVEVRVDSLQRIYQGKVARFTSQLSSATRTMETEVDIRNVDGALRPGMFGTASLILERRHDAVAVPIQAISRGSAKRTIFVVTEDGQVQERTVTTGLETPSLVEVLNGLREHELVVTGNRGGIRPGMHVEPLVLTAKQVEGGD